MSKEHPSSEADAPREPSEGTSAPLRPADYAGALLWEPDDASDPEGEAWDDGADEIGAESSPSGTQGRFVDEIVVTFESGKGGDGLVAWRREAKVNRGGPAGGNGGRGGDVVLVADPGLSTLLDLKRKRVIKADDGRPGGPSCRTGASGPAREVRLPVGTLVRDRQSGKLLADLKVAHQRAVICKGGRGGSGNAAFTSSTRRSPDFAHPGGEGQRREALLTLKLMADVGLVGLPNAGKSTLLRRLSNARPKVADYPFTTLVPSLGVVEHREENFVMADIPGLIEGASEGAGLGHRFLRHVERTAVFLFLVDVGPERPDPLDAYDLLARELERYDASLAARPRVVAFTKTDLPESQERMADLARAFAARGLPFAPISAATGEGLDVLLDLLLQRVTEHHRTL